MSTEIILAVIAIVATPVTGWLASRLTRSKYTAEIAKLRADVSAANADASNKELRNARLGNEIIMENIVGPLGDHLKRLNKNVTKLEKAIAKIPACPHSAECPVSVELRTIEESDDDGSASGGNDRGEYNPRTPSRKGGHDDSRFTRQSEYSDQFDDQHPFDNRRGDDYNDARV